MEEQNKLEEVKEVTPEVVEETPVVASLETPVAPNKPSKKKTGLLVGIIVILIVAIVGVLAFLNKENVFKKGDNKPKEAEVGAKVVNSNYRLAGNGLENFDLYFMQVENPGKNMIYSPLSIKYALEMLAEGTDGDSRAQLDALIGDYVARKYPNNKNMSFANAMFIKDTFKNDVKKEYVSNLKNKYNAEVVYDSFKTPDVLNKWVSDKTLKLIPQLMSDISDKDFVLVNALAIDMEWVKKIQSEHEDYSVYFPHQEFSVDIVPLDSGGYHTLEFNNKKGVDIKSVEIGAVIHKYDIIKTLGEKSIRETVGSAYEDFVKDEDSCKGDDETLENKDKVVNQYIKEIKGNYGHVSKSTDFYFYDDKEVKVFAKDLKKYDGITLQYVGIMPKNISLSDYVSGVKADDINKIINNLKDIKAENFEDGVITYVKGFIPMFDFEYELPLLKDLQKLNVIDIFDPGKADLSKMVNSDSEFIDTAVHKANIEFSNVGIKAAAATAMGGRGAADCGFDYIYDVPVKTIDLTFDKPFMFVIRDKDTGEVWFTGNVYEPKVMDEEDYFDGD